MNEDELKEAVVSAIDDSLLAQWPWTKSDDEKRRAWVLEIFLSHIQYGSATNALKDAELAVRWLRDGVLSDDKIPTMKVIK